MQLLLPIFTFAFQIPWNPHVILLSLPACPPPADKSAGRLCALVHEGFINF